MRLLLLHILNKSTNCTALACKMSLPYKANKVLRRHHSLSKGHTKIISPSQVPMNRSWTPVCMTVKPYDTPLVLSIIWLYEGGKSAHKGVTKKKVLQQVPSKNQFHFHLIFLILIQY